MLAKLRNSLCIQRWFPALVDVPFSLRQGHPFPPPFPNERALKLCKGTQHGKHQGRPRVITASGKAHILFNEINRYTAVVHLPDKPEHVLHVARPPVHGMDDERIPCANMIRAARSCGLFVSLPDALSVNTLSR